MREAVCAGAEPRSSGSRAERGPRAPVWLGPPPPGPRPLNLQRGPSAWPGSPGAGLALEPAGVVTGPGLGWSLTGLLLQRLGPLAWAQHCPVHSILPEVPSLSYSPASPASPLLCAWASISSSRGPHLPCGHPALLPLPLLILWGPAAPGVPDAPANQGEMTQGSPRVLSRGGWPVSAWRGRGGEGFGGAGSGGAPRVKAGETRMGYPRPSCREGAFNL